MTSGSEPLEDGATTGPAYRIGTAGLERLFDLVRREYDEVFGPRLVDGAITLERLERFDELPVGYRDRQAPGSYAVEASGDPTLFHYAVGPHSVKKLLHPSSRRLWHAQKTAEGWELSNEAAPTQSRALFGIRSCDVESIDVLDGVFTGSDHTEPHYRAAREQLLLITASCPQPSGVCFCTSMGHGPKPRRYDINLTEIFDGTSHYFFVESASERGRELLDILAGAIADADSDDMRLADAADAGAAASTVETACRRIGKTLDTDGLAADIGAERESPHWEDVAERCLACGNCTMVCPTCFCTTTYDVTDLAGSASEHWQTWDSCFNTDFSYLHGGAIRQSVSSRYRQWLSHKLSTWFDQFGRSGCVGCGRCIAWCPVQIDIVEEAKKLRG
jgi:ferredoxin